MELKDTLELRKIFDSAEKEIEENYKKQVLFHFTRLTEKFGPTLHNIYNSKEYFNFKGIVAPNVYRKTQHGIVSDETYMIDEEKLNINAQKYANLVIDEGVAKVIKKLGRIENLTGTKLNKAGYGVSFHVTGTRGVDKIVLDQQMIINVSKKGKLFNQWPARIYVNGKMISEKEFKTL